MFTGHRRTRGVYFVGKAARAARGDGSGFPDATLRRVRHGRSNDDRSGHGDDPESSGVSVLVRKLGGRRARSRESRRPDGAFGRPDRFGAWLGSRGARVLRRRRGGHLLRRRRQSRRRALRQPHPRQSHRAMDPAR